MTPNDLPELAFVRTIGADRLRTLLNRTKGTCTWCGGELPRGRRSWCSQSCIDRFCECWNPDWIRRQAFKRDKGICANCGHDAQYWLNWLQRMKRGYGYREDRLCGHQDKQYPYREHVNRRSRKNRRRFQRYRAAWHKTLVHLMHWEADHIVPVVRGGAMLGMANIRTLCKRCHDAQTAKLAGERAAERKPLAANKPKPETRQLTLI